MKTMTLPLPVGGEPFVDAREAAYTMNLPMYYLTNARQRAKLCLPHYRIGRLVRFKNSGVQRTGEKSIVHTKENIGKRGIFCKNSLIQYRPSVTAL